MIYLLQEVFYLNCDGQSVSQLLVDDHDSPYKLGCKPLIYVQYLYSSHDGLHILWDIFNQLVLGNLGIYNIYNIYSI